MLSPDKENLYALLGVRESASAEEIRAAYVRKIKAVHPDVNPGHEEEAKRIILAYRTLRDPDKRREYDVSVQVLACTAS